jgi:hypothetical protein
MAAVMAASLLLLLPSGAAALPRTSDDPRSVTVKSYGAVGDGVADDWLAIQRGINATHDGTLYFPLGTYLVSQPLQLNCGHLLGEGRSAVIILAKNSMEAVLRIAGSQPGSGWLPDNSTAKDARTNGRSLEGITFDGAGKADFAVFAPAITRSRFTASAFNNARVAGLYIGYGWINDIFQCSFMGRMLVGLYLDDAINSVNVIDSQFEANGDLGVGIVVNAGAMVRIEGNCLEGLAGPAIIANQVNALTIRSNYFEVNNMKKNYLNVTDNTGAAQQVCTDILINGDDCVYNDCTTPDLSNSLSLARFAAAAKGQKQGTLSPGPIVINNHSPCRSVVVEGNFHNPGGDLCPSGVEFFGTFAAGAEGLRSESNDCSDCEPTGGPNKGKLARVCRAVGTSLSSDARVTLSDFDIRLNTGHFAAAK